MQELEIEGMLERVIRMLLILNFHTEHTKPVFLMAQSVFVLI